MGPWQAALFAQYLLTGLSAALNAVYFGGYRSPRPGRRLGALALTLVSSATLVESLYFGLLLLLDPERLPLIFLSDARWVVARALVGLGSLSLSVLILRRLLSS